MATRREGGVCGPLPSPAPALYMHTRTIAPSRFGRLGRPPTNLHHQPRPSLTLQGATSGERARGALELGIWLLAQLEVEGKDSRGRRDFHSSRVSHFSCIRFFYKSGIKTDHLTLSEFLNQACLYNTRAASARSGRRALCPPHLLPSFPKNPSVASPFLSPLKMLQHHCFPGALVIPRHFLKDGCPV